MAQNQLRLIIGAWFYRKNRFVAEKKEARESRPGKKGEGLAGA
jgi:hypothetical protein